jgi:hypothetical protein
MHGPTHPTVTPQDGHVVSPCDVAVRLDAEGEASRRGGAPGQAIVRAAEDCFARAEVADVVAGLGRDSGDARIE